MAVEAPTLGSLFSGGGGLDAGLEAAGFEVRWQVEWDPWQQHVLEFGWGGRWRDVPRLGDIGAVDFARLERVDLLAGGFPCQPVSTAGLRLGQDDPRWLWPQFARAIRHLRPRYVLVENVPGLLVRGLGDVLGDLSTLGYDAEWTSFPAAALGAPHLRDRVWIVAYPRGGVSDPGGAGLRDERQRDRQQHPEPGTAESRHDGPEGRVADADGGRRGPDLGHLRAGQPDPAGRGPELADADGEPVWAGLRPDGPPGVGWRRSGDGGGPADVDHAARERAGRPRLGAERPGGPRPDSSSVGRLADPLADATGGRVEGDGADWLVIPPAQALAELLGRHGAGRGAGFWASEPDVGRMAHGVARRGDRLWTLGNGVVPAVGEVMGTLIRRAMDATAG